MKITIEQVLEWGPCEAYKTEELLLAVTGGRREMELLDALALDIPVDDKIWLGWHALPAALRSEWACDCAWRVLPIYERKYPGDRRPRAAIEARRAWNDGLISDRELAAARSAALDAAMAADWAAALDAARAAARSAALDAARAAALAAAAALDFDWDAALAADWAVDWSADWATARDAAGASPRAAERTWQLERMIHYARQVRS